MHIQYPVESSGHSAIHGPERKSFISNQQPQRSDMQIKDRVFYITGK